MCSDSFGSLANISSSSSVSVRCWGVRGNFPSLEKNQYYYGGHTNCIEICLGNQRLIFDGGSGLCALGQSLNAGIEALASLEAHIFFTCSRWDRIQGFPFFLPAFQGGHRFHIYGPVAITGASIKQQLMDQMRRPYCAVCLWDMKAELLFDDIAGGEPLAIAADSRFPITIETFTLNAVEQVLGYRICWHHWTLVYATAVEAPQDAPTGAALVAMAQGADLLIYGTADSDHDWRTVQHPLGEAFDPQAIDWGWQAGLALAEQAQVKRLIVTRHRPFCSDAWLQEFERHLQQRFAHSCLAREGMAMTLTQDSFP